MVTSGTFGCPSSQSIPIAAHARLIHARVVMASRIQKCIICHAHHVLPQSIEAMHVMLHRPLWNRADGKSHVVFTDILLSEFQSWSVMISRSDNGSTYKTMHSMVSGDDVHNFTGVQWMSD